MASFMVRPAIEALEVANFLVCAAATGSADLPKSTIGPGRVDRAGTRIWDGRQAPFFLPILGYPGVPSPQALREPSDRRRGSQAE
jgi:hypothetical protein